MPGRNRKLEFDIMGTIYQSTNSLTSIEIARILESKHVERYSSWLSFKNFVIKKLKWLWARRILDLDGKKYTHDQRWDLTEFGSSYYEALRNYT